MKRILLTVISISLGSLLIELITAPLRGYVNFLVAGIVAFALFAVYTSVMLYRCKSIKPVVIIAAILLGWAVINLPLRILYWQIGLISLPEGMMHLLGILSGYLFWKFNKIGKVCYVILSIVLCFLYADNYMQIVNKLKEGTFTGRISETIKTPIVFQNGNGDSVALSDLDKDYIVLEFWSSTCGVCFKKLPEIEKIYNSISETEHIAFYSVFCRLSDRNETPQSGVSTLAGLGYSFPVLSVDWQDPIMKEIDIKVVPTIVVFDRKGTMIFRGSIELAERYLRQLTAI